MTCPESRVGQWQLARKALGLLPLDPWPFGGGCSSLVLGEEERERKTLLLPEQEHPLGLMLLLLEGPVGEASTSRYESWWAFSLPQGQFTCHRLWIKFLFTKHPSSKVPLSDQPKKNQPPCPELGVTDPSLLFRSQHSSGFYSLFLYKRKLFKSHKMTVNFSNQVPITCMIFVYALVHYACSNEG